MKWYIRTNDKIRMQREDLFDIGLMYDADLFCVSCLFLYRFGEYL